MMGSWLKMFVTRRSLPLIGAWLMAPQVALAGGVACVVTDPVWQAGHSSAQTSISTAVDTMASTFATQSALTHEKLISAIRTHTRQRSLSGEQTAMAQTANAEAAANVYVEQRAAEMTRNAYDTYGPQGQMVGGCEMIASLQLAEDAMRGRDERAAEVAEGDAIDAAPGQATAPLVAAARRLASDGPEAVSAVSFFDGATSAAAKDAFMNNLIGLPFVRPDGIDGAEDEISFMQTRRWEAMRSPAIASLTSVRAASDAAEGSQSYLDALDWYVGQYGGGPDYEEWSASLVTKSEVGLLKEIARLRAINLELSSYRQDSQDRQLAVISTLLAGVAVQ